jgi:uncharacterized repeat protein (TIGR03803 family)
MFRLVTVLGKNSSGRSLPAMLARAGGLASVILLGTFALTALAGGQTENTIYTFALTESFWPEGGLVEDAIANLYGTTVGGGTYGAGTVYQLSPPTSGTTWTKTVLWNFQTWAGTGYTPSSELSIDKNGTLYGVTWSGGDTHCQCGVLYKLVPPAIKGGAWTQSILHAFTSNGSDGRLPNVPVVFSSTSIYGVTEQGGPHDSGVAYQLTPGKSGGKPTYKVLYAFGANNDASSPGGPLLLDSAGNLYGVTAFGGAFNSGAVFKLSPQTSGAWTESILFNFGGGTDSSGTTPVGNLLFDSLGNLYGVTEFGGLSSGFGVAYQLTPSSGFWTENVMFNFSDAAGAYPLAGLTWNPTNGSLYGTASAGLDHGVVFQLAPSTSGGWTETSLHQFTFADGGLPWGRVLRDPTTGYLYGTTYNGGASGCDGECGVDYQIIP